LATATAATKFNSRDINVDGERKKKSPPLHLTYHIAEMHIISFFQVLLEFWITVVVRHGEMFTYLSNKSRLGYGTIST
jgi:hypothetical protein